MRMPPDLRSPTFILSAAGFMATRTSRSSPGVNTSFEEKLSWKALTPASVPAGARISAGEAGRVAGALPASADPGGNCLPGTRMPSPPAPRGRARQMNAGAAAARGDVLLFLHADTRLPAGYAQAVAGALADPAVVGGRFDVRLDAAGLAYRAIGRLISLRSRLTRVATGDQAIFVRRAVFERLGGYPLVPLMEDVALSRAMKRVGRVACLSETVTTSARRWQRHGVARTVLVMWALRAAYYAGVPPARLARVYPHAR